MILFLAYLASVASAPYRPLTAAAPPATTAATCMGEKTVAEKDGGGGPGIANLPYAMGRSFITLDAYLEHLECRAGPIDMPWWREVRPGIYEHMKTATNAVPETATRAELMTRFGFTK